MAPRRSRLPYFSSFYSPRLIDTSHCVAAGGHCLSTCAAIWILMKFSMFGCTKERKLTRPAADIDGYSFPALLLHQDIHSADRQRERVQLSSGFHVLVGRVAHCPSR